jgi:hypothetical protein
MQMPQEIAAGPYVNQSKHKGIDEDCLQLLTVLGVGSGSVTA